MYVCTKFKYFYRAFEFLKAKQFFSDSYDVKQLKFYIMER